MRRPPACPDRFSGAPPSPLPSNQPAQLRRHDPLRLRLGCLAVQFTGVVFPQAPFHAQKHLPLKTLAAQTPATLHRSQNRRIGLFCAPSLHPCLKPLPPGRAILLNPVLAQQPVHPDPLRPMLGRRQIGAKTAPRVGQEPLPGRDQPGAHRVQMHVIAGRPQIPIAAALHEL